MKKLDRFILKSFVLPFIAILAVVVFILVMQFLWLYIDELVGKGLSMKVILEFLMWGGCTILPLSLPLATLLAAMMTLGTMTENNELMAIKASGVSILRVMLPIGIVCVGISVGAYFIGNNLVPKAYNEIYTLRDDIGRTKSEIKIPSGTFYDGIDGYILRVEEQDSDGGMMHGVMVYDHTSNKGNVSMTLADSATMRMSKNKENLVFVLYNGTNYQETNNRSYKDTTLDLQKIQFEKQELIISLKNYAFEKSEDNRFGNQIKSQNVAQLKHEQDSLRSIVTSVYDDHYRQMSKSGNFTFQKQLDTSVYNPARTAYHNDKFCTWKTRTAKIEALKKASEKADRMATQMTEFTHDTYVENYYLRRADVEILKKFAQALACFVLFILGAPLGALVGKGGLGSSAIISVLFFVLYWVVDISGTKLAQDGAISATSGAFISTYVLLPIGIFFTWKAVHDSSFASMDAFKAWWRKVWSKIARIFRRTRIVFMGTPEFAVASLDALVKARYNIVGVVTVADKPIGRGQKMGESAVKKYAVEHGIPVLQPLKLKDPEFLASLRALKADLFVVVAFRMLPEEVWTMPRLGTFNLHAALLPQYRGAAPINWAVINGERLTGVTTFMIDKNIDTGGIILRQECKIAPDDNVGQVHDKLMAIGSGLVVETVEGIIQKNVETRVQRSFIQGSEVLKPAPKLNRELCHIDWNDTAGHIHNLVRGLSPYPGAFTELVRDGSEPTQLKIYASARIAAGDPRLGGTRPAPGTIITDGRSYLAIAATDGAVELLDVQLSGKKRMPAAAFLAGFRDPATWRTTPGTSKAEIEKTRTDA